MIGTIINSITIALGCTIGLLLKGKITEKISTTIMNGLALCIIYIGISGSLKGTDTILILVSIAVGALLGEIIDIDNWLNRLGNFIEKKVKNKDSEISISEGFVSASLIFCVGAMAIVGSLESGLKGDHTTLYAKSILDGVTSIIFSSTLGIGVMLSAVSVFIYQGSITLGANLISGFLSDALITNMSAIGSLLIIAIGLNMLKLTKIKVANLLPAIFVYMIIATVKGYLGY
ncbi:MAG: DUF554 domain-containing protein [Clostridiaceae bacterium]